MRKEGLSFVLTASDLVNHLACQRLTALDLAVASGHCAKPDAPWDPSLDVLRERGFEHERRYVRQLQASGRQIHTIDSMGVGPRAVEETRTAMHRGEQVIVQGALAHGRWEGRPDILQRVDVPTKLGKWGYEVVDTKLARETKAGTILQLSLYSQLVASVQGTTPRLMHVVTPRTLEHPETYATGDFSAYFDYVRLRLERMTASIETEPAYPDPKTHCDVCRWSQLCEDRRRADDHLCLVANISALQIAELREHGINSMAALSTTPLPLAWRPARGSAQSYERVREQARVQVQSRNEQRPIYEVLPMEPGQGLARLPTPSAGDVFFDLEGDPFIGDGGLEYLFGCVYEVAGELHYRADWALTRTDEKRAFESLIDWLMERLRLHPEMHVYHYAPYEPGALKRLMGRYATREEEVDQLLRGDRLVDLYGIVRRSIRAGVESYSIKRLETFYGFARTVPLRDANVALFAMQSRLELGDAAEADPAERAAIEGYNRDDCISTYALRRWLEAIREEEIARGSQIDRPLPREGAASEDVSEWTRRVGAIQARLIDGISPDISERGSAEQARWVLANILDWHRREKKANWWEYFRLCDLVPEDLMDERPAVSGLEFIGPVGGTGRAPVHRYHFPPQEIELRDRDKLRCAGGEPLGSVEAIDFEARTIDIKKMIKTADVHPVAAFAFDDVPTSVLRDALVSVGEDVAANGVEIDNIASPARSLLLRAPPTVMQHSARDEPGRPALDVALSVASDLDGDVLAIQGPPGAGKTFTGARMVLKLARGGARVGITANSHKVIRNLLDEVARAAAKEGEEIRAIQKVRDLEGHDDPPAWLSLTTTNAGVFDELHSSHRVAAGTSWLWAHPDAAESVDVLFVDEAAQMSLANVLAISRAGKSLVLLGDPQQLDQPTQGSHPDGTDVSALAYILGPHQTIAAGAGLFLSETWRLHPEICRFTSQTFYDGRLRPVAGLERQCVVAQGPYGGSGLRLMSVPHSGNQNASLEEVNAICELVARMLRGRPTWVDKLGVEKPLTLNDILIIAPYNAQVFALKERLRGARIGTVDKFQGQEAPIVIYSMATSTPADAPRGMEFLYSLNRLNVATSRAQCLCVLVASPDLFEPECRTPRQIQLANAMCRYAQLATPLRL